MALDDDIRVLGEVALFEGFSQEQLRLLAFGAENLSFAKGRELYSAGSPAEAAFVVVSGRVELTTGEADRQIVVRTLEAGAVLGEMALLAETMRPTNARAAAPSELIKLNRRLFRRILEEYPEVALTMHARITGELKSLIDELATMGSRFQD